MIRLSGLNKFFNKNRQNQIHVLNNVNLELPEKGLVAIYGKSGCGKTTLLNVIGGLDGVESGSVLIDGADMSVDTDVLRNQYVGYVFQNYNLHKQETVFENVAAALRLCGMDDAAEIDGRVTAALKNVGMDKYKLRTPDTLSGGQQQRVAIARALVKNPRILLADEPTGNLDEANTIVVMDLLKQISRDHLVLLVTHEANLVEFYCDRVIEIVDGRINSVRENRDAHGYTQRDKNGIYLGEFEKKTTLADGIELEYFARDGQELPLNLKIINDNGKIYLKLSDPKVKIIDRTSELRLHEGVYNERAVTPKAEIDMSGLQPFQGKRFGRLFSWKSSLVSGLMAASSQKNRTTGIFRRVMTLFALAAVMIAAVFGPAFRQYGEAASAYNHNLFYVYVENGGDVKKIRESLGKNGIDNFSLLFSRPQYSFREIIFGLGKFETYQGSLLYLAANNVFFLEDTLAKDLKCVAGTKELKTRGEVLITTAAADKLIESAGVDYIKSYDDIVGLISNDRIFGAYARIVGVVESEERNLYFMPAVLADDIINNTQLALINAAGPDNAYGEVAPGKAVWLSRVDFGKFNPKIGDMVEINGVEVEVIDVIRTFDSYEDFFGKTFAEFLEGKMQEAWPGHDAWLEEHEAWLCENYFAFEEEYYARLSEYLNRMVRFGGVLTELQMMAWMAAEKNIGIAKFVFYNNFAQSYFADQYKKLHGAYPVYESAEFSDFIISQGGEREAQRELDRARNGLWDEFWQSIEEKAWYYNYCYFVNESDYVAISKSMGRTHITAVQLYYGWVYFYPDEPWSSTVIVKPGYPDYPAELPEYIEDIFNFGYYGNYKPEIFLMIHSNDVAATEQFLSGEFGGREQLLGGKEGGFNYALVTPQNMFELLKSEMGLSITMQLIAMAVVLGLLSLCMYFIMRSSLMARVKEVGIYRAIGVSRRNLLFKFLVEALVLTTLTIFVGFAVASVLLFAWLGSSPLMSQIFYYPVWLAGTLLLLLYLISSVCGLLPVFTLLRKTPSAIMAKYDI
ncbi:MAG: ABC transporter ATP-binding protein/permease [Clostridiales bacterium]|nr:ABC transporter ATP-binding protein/permease [Clostridiales bacterium]